MPYEDGTFDAAFLVTVLGEVPDQDSALRELARVLQPGGRLIVGELLGDPHYVSQRASGSGLPAQGCFRAPGRAPRSATSPASRSRRARPSGPRSAVQSRSSASSTRSASALDRLPVLGSGCSGPLAVRAASASSRPVPGRLRRDRRLLVAGLLEKARVHLAGSCRRRSRGARSPGRGSGRTTANPRRSRASSPTSAAKRRSAGQPLEVAERRLEHPAGRPLDRLRGVGEQVVPVELRPVGQSIAWPSSGKIGCWEWRASRRPSSEVVCRSSKAVSDTQASSSS